MEIKNIVEIPETNPAYNKVLYWFFSFPIKETTLNDLVKETNISKTTANKVINDLIKESFIKREVIGKTWKISCNIDHPYNKSKKICYNLELIYNSGLINEINKKYNLPKVIILFGSYRKGDDTEKSDIDIALEILGDKKLEIKEFIKFKNMGYRKDVKINLHIFSRKNINSNLFANISNGIVLDGFLEVTK